MCKYLIIFLFLILPCNIVQAEIIDLKRAQEIAIQNNPSLEAAKEQINQAKEKIKQAYSSYWPSIDASASVNHLRQSDKSLLTSSMDNPEDVYGSTIKATWLLFDGFERKFTTLSAKYSNKETKQSYLDLVRVLISYVAESYYNAQLAQQKIEIAQADKSFNLRQLKDAQAKYQIGTGSLSDVLNFKVQVNSAKSDLITSQKEYEVAMYALFALMGIKNDPLKTTLSDLEKEKHDELLLPDINTLLNFAIKNRPDIKKADYSIQKAESDIKKARAAFFPDINLAASFDGERLNNSHFDEDDFGSSAGIYMSYNIFSGGSDLSYFRQAKHQKKETEKTFENTKNTIESEVYQAIAKLKAAQKQLCLQRENAALVKQNRDLVEKEYTAGQTSLVRLNEAQKDLVTAQGQLAQALISLRVAWQNLQAVTGKNLLLFTLNM